MATCNPTTLLADGAAFQNLDDEALRISQIQLLVEWAQTLDPGLDCTPGAILSRGAMFQYLNDNALKMAIAQLLCNIKGP